MNEFLARSLSLAQDFLDRQPDLALMLGGALFAFSSRRLCQPPATPPPALTPTPTGPRTVPTPVAAASAPADPVGGGVWSTLLHAAGRCLWTGVITTALLTVHTGIKSYLGQVDRNFSAHHGRVTNANAQAVRTIWGNEQRQIDLNADLTYEEETEERVQAAELDKPDIIHKVKKTRTVEGNPFRAEHHTVTLKTNARKKGSAWYAGYETDCQFAWDLVNPADREVKAALRFPLPSDSAVYAALTLTFNGIDALPAAHFDNGALVLEHTLAPGQACKLALAFQSRGLAWWYFQIPTQRELRDFTLTLNLPDIPLEDLNYPEGCMTPTLVAPLPVTAIPPAASGTPGVALTFHLDHALTTKGMGIDLPKLTQPGEETGAILSATGRGFTLFFSLILIGFVVLDTPHAALLTVLISIPVAYSFGLLGDLSDTALPFYAALPLAVVPLTGVALAVLYFFASQTKIAPAPNRFTGTSARGNAWILTVAAAILCLAYPLAAGLDDGRVFLYNNVAGLLWLGTFSWLLIRRSFRNPVP